MSPKSAWTNRILKDVLSSAIESVEHDEQWNVSGIPELLVRAREMAERGCASALRMAVSLLDFHKMVDRYRGKVASTLSNSLRKRGCEEADSHDGSFADGSKASADAASSRCQKRRRLGDNDDSSSGNSSASSDGSEFAVPELPAFGIRGARASACRSAPSTRRASGTATCDQVPSPSKPSPAVPVWSGSLRHCHAGNDWVLANLDVRLPTAFSLRLPGDLHVSHLVQRSSVKIGSHHACRTSLARSRPDQLAKLNSLAQHQLVAVAPLGPAGSRGALVLVPYLDNGATLRCVSFLLSSAPVVAGATR